MRIKKKERVELTIEDIAFGGRGLAKVEGLAIFVEGAIVGDRVRALIIRKRKNHVEARVETILEPSPYRIQPPCPYSGICGGCKWQHLDYERQLYYKQKQVKETLAHIGGLKAITVHPTISSPTQFNYRNKMEFTCAERRWLMPEELHQSEVEQGMALGLHVPGTFYKVLDINACLLQPELGNRILDTVRNYIKASGLPVYGLRSHIGFWRFLVLRHSQAHDQWMVNIVTTEENRAALQPLSDKLMAKYPAVVSVINNITARKAGIAVGEREIVLGGSATIRDRLGPFEFEISANSFFQTNTRGAEQLYETVAAYVAPRPNDVVVDLYSGTGTIAIWLAQSAQEVIGLELNEWAVRDAEKNCRTNAIDNCRFMAGDIRDLLQHVKSNPSVLVIDPPRAGMHKDVVKRILQMRPVRIVYVSCNPATLARDLTFLKEVYQVCEVQPVDMFPHTFHIESVARLELKS